MDKAYGLTKTGNSEVRFCWHILCLRAKAMFIVPHVLDFATSMVREGGKGTGNHGEDGPIRDLRKNTRRGRVNSGKTTGGEPAYRCRDHHISSLDLPCPPLPHCSVSCLVTFKLVFTSVCTQGRMKFTRPLYRELYMSVDTQTVAVETFKERALFYHPICRTMVAKDLGVDLGAHLSMSRT